MIRSSVYYLFYRMNRLDIESVYQRYTEELQGESEKEMAVFCLSWFEELIKPLIFPEALELIDSHKAAGRPVVIISNATQFIVGPMAAYLDVDDFLCTTLESREGVLTGKVKLPLCYGAGKVHYAAAWSKPRGLEIEDSYFYSDSYSDLDLLERVRYPVAVNPDSKLRKTARRHNWRIMDFKSVPKSKN